MRGPLFALLALTLVSNSFRIASGDRIVEEAAGVASTEALDLPGPAYVPGEILVGLRSDGAEKRAARGIDLARQLDLELVPAPGLERFGAVKMRTRGLADPAAAAAVLATLPDVAYVERNALFYPASVPSDPLYQGVNKIATDYQRWLFNGDGDNRVLNAEVAWDMSKGDPKVVIAVIDSGTDTDNPEFKHLWVNRREEPDNGVDDDRNGYVDDVNGFDFFNRRGDVNPELGDGIDNNGDGRADESSAHGTIVASVAAASQDDGVGMTGGAPECSIMTVKVFGDERGVPADTLVEAIAYAADNGAKVINLSLVSYVDSDPVHEVTSYAFKKNIVLVAAAGNANAGYAQYPAAYPTVIGVGGSDGGFDGEVSTGKVNRRWRLSQFGPSVDLVAPAVVLGSLVVSTGKSIEDPSLVAGSTTYEVVSGTSFAAPLVAALAALVIAHDVELHGERTLSNGDIQALLDRTAMPLGNDTRDVPDAGHYWAGAGRIDYAAALAKIPGASEPNPIISGATFKKGLLRVIGDNFSRESTIEVNGTALALPVKYSFANGTLEVSGKRKALKLQKGAANQIVVVERGVRSSVFELML